MAAQGFNVDNPRFARAGIVRFPDEAGADPQDPIGNLPGLRQALPNSRVVTVPGQGHGVGQFGCLGELVGRFVDRGTVKGLDTSCAAKTPLTPFATR